MPSDIFSEILVDFSPNASRQEIRAAVEAITVKSVSKWRQENYAAEDVEAITKLTQEYVSAHALDRQKMAEFSASEEKKHLSSYYMFSRNVRKDQSDYYAKKGQEIDRNWINRRKKTK